MTFTPDGGGEPMQFEVAHYGADGGVAMGMYNYNDSIRDFARASFRYGLDRNYPVYLSHQEHDPEGLRRAVQGPVPGGVRRRVRRSSSRPPGLTYEHRLIDDMVAAAMKWEGGYVWACKNYDGDVQSDTVAQGFGSLGLMTSVLITPDGQTMEAEAAHGTVTRHYREHQKGNKTSTNPIASIFAWTRGIAHRGKLDGTPEVTAFADTLEAVCVEAVESGEMTKDLALLISKDQPWLTTEDFLDALDERLQAKMGAELDAPPPITGVLFDWGHTLFDTAGSVEFIVEWAARSGRPVTSDEAARLHLAALQRSRRPDELAKGRDLSAERPPFVLARAVGRTRGGGSRHRRPALRGRDERRGLVAVPRHGRRAAHAGGHRRASGDRQRRRRSTCVRSSTTTVCSTSSTCSCSPASTHR